MKTRTTDLSGAALDWAVATCVWTDRVVVAVDEYGRKVRVGVQPVAEVDQTRTFQYSPSTDWSQGGGLIERIKGFTFKSWLESKQETCCEAHIHNYEGDWIAFGPTPLIAAMRCYVMAKLGDEVDVPEELL
jgi:hypothetical protein